MTDPNLAEDAFQAGRAGAEKPEAHGEVEQRVVDGFYRAGLREAGRPVGCKRALYGTPGAEQRGLDVPHEPGG